MSQSTHSSHCTEGLSVFLVILIKNHEFFADSYITSNREMPCTRHFWAKQMECIVQLTAVVITNELSKYTSVCEVGNIMVHTGGGLKLCSCGVGTPPLATFTVSHVGDD